MSDKLKAPRLTGLHPLAYMGAEATSPPQLVYGKDRPDSSNVSGFNIGSIWMVIKSRTIFMLTGLAGDFADWTQIYPETSETETFPTDVGTAESDAAGELNVFGDVNIVTTGLHSTLTTRTENDLTIIGTLTMPLLGKGFIRSSGVGLLSSLSDGTDGQLIIASSLGAPAWQEFTSSDASFTITPGSNSIDIVVGGGGPDVTSFDTDSGVATPAAGVITMAGGTNINTAGGASTVTVNLDASLSFVGSVTAATDITSTTGDIVASAGAVSAGTSVTAGNDLTVTTGPVTFGALGAGVVQSSAAGLISSSNGTDGQVIIGGGAAPAWDSITSGDASITFTTGANTLDLSVSGSAALTDLDTDVGSTTPTAGVIDIAGGTNINTAGAGSTVTINLDASPSLAGSATAATDVTSTTGNIVASAGAVVAGTSVTAGNGLTVTTGTVTFGGLGVGVVQTDAAGLLSSSNGTAGQVLIGGGTAPAWANLISSDATVNIVNGANTIDLTVIADKDRIIGDTGVAIPDGASTITVAGGTNITTAAVGDTLTINLDNSINLSGSLTVSPLNGTVYADATGLFTASQGTNSQFYVGSTGTIPDWLDPVSEDGSVTIAAGTVPGTLNFQAIGGGGAGTLVTISSDAGVATPDGAGDVQIAGGLNINTSAAGKVVTVNLDLSIYQPTTNITGTEGVYYLGGNRFMHGRGTHSTFVGEDSGHLSMANNSCVGIGAFALDGTTTTPMVATTAFGVGAMGNTGRLACDYNLAVGVLAGWGLNAGGNSDLIIRYTGGSTVVHEPINTVEIGEQGVTATSQTECYIAGIYNGGALDITRREPAFVDGYGHVSSDGSSTDGDLLIGSNTWGFARVARAKLTSSTGEITITNGPFSIDLAETQLTSFAAYQAATVNNVTGDGTTYSLGQSLVLNEYWDDGGNFYIGDGVGHAAYFTAPVSGKYYFTASIVASNLNNVPVWGDSVRIYVDTTGGPSFFNPVTAALGTQGIFCSGIVHLNVADKVYFRFKADIAAAGKTIGVAGTSTHVSGFLVARDV